MSPGTLDLQSAFLAVIDALVEVGIDHAFIGALPVLAWGRVRATTDIDLVVLTGDRWDRLTDALRRREFRPERTVGPSEPADALPDIAVFRGNGDPPVRVDIFSAKTEFERVVIETARVAPVLATQVRLARPEASIISRFAPGAP